jgi:hypothetical protein
VKKRQNVFGTAFFEKAVSVKKVAKCFLSWHCYFFQNSIGLSVEKKQNVFGTAFFEKAVFKTTGTINSLK